MNSSDLPHTLGLTHKVDRQVDILHLSWKSQKQLKKISFPMQYFNIHMWEIYWYMYMYVLIQSVLHIRGGSRIKNPTRTAWGPDKFIETDNGLVGALEFIETYLEPCTVFTWINSHTVHTNPLLHFFLVSTFYDTQTLSQIWSYIKRHDLCKGTDSLIRPATSWVITISPVFYQATFRQGCEKVSFNRVLCALLTSKSVVIPAEVGHL